MLSLINVKSAPDQPVSALSLLTLTRYYITDNSTALSVSGPPLVRDRGPHIDIHPAALGPELHLTLTASQMSRDGS